MLAEIIVAPGLADRERANETGEEEWQWRWKGSVMGRKAGKGDERQGKNYERLTYRPRKGPRDTETRWRSGHGIQKKPLGKMDCARQKHEDEIKMPSKKGVHHRNRIMHNWHLTLIYHQSLPRGYNVCANTHQTIAHTDKCTQVERETRTATPRDTHPWRGRNASTKSRLFSRNKRVTTGDIRLERSQNAHRIHLRQ